MCTHGETIVLDLAAGPAAIDRCLAPLVQALNDAGLSTIACCCGHGHRPGNIALKDGREIVIAPDFDTGRRIDALFPVNIHGEDLATLSGGGMGPATTPGPLIERLHHDTAANHGEPATPGESGHG